MQFCGDQSQVSTTLNSHTNIRRSPGSKISGLPSFFCKIPFILLRAKYYLLGMRQALFLFKIIALPQKVNFVEGISSDP